MAEKEYIGKEAFNYAIREAVKKYPNSFYNGLEVARQIAHDFPAADVRPVVVCANCEHNNHCLTQEFVDDCGKIPLDRNTFFCADGERRSNA